MAFLMHEKLVADCEPLGDFDLCTALMMRDHRFPWVVLVPRIADLRDFHDLPRQHAPTLFDEIEAVSTALVEAFAAEKITSPPWETKCRSYTFTSSGAMRTTRPGRRRCGVRAPSPTSTTASWRAGQRRCARHWPGDSEATTAVPKAARYAMTSAAKNGLQLLRRIDYGCGSAATTGEAVGLRPPPSSQWPGFAL